MAAPHSPSLSESARWKLPARFGPFAFAFFMAAIMAFLMCSVIVAVGSGFGSGYALRVLHAYVIAMPTAFVCVLAVRPIVVKLIGWTVQKPMAPPPSPAQAAASPAPAQPIQATGAPRRHEPGFTASSGAGSAGGSASDDEAWALAFGVPLSMSRSYPRFTSTPYHGSAPTLPYPPVAAYGCAHMNPGVLPPKWRGKRMLRPGMHAFRPECCAWAGLPAQPAPAAGMSIVAHRHPAPGVARFKTYPRPLYRPYPR